MHPRIAELLQYVEAQTTLLHDAYFEVPPEHRGMRPSPDRWSPAECVHHVAIVERRLAQRLKALIGEARTFPPEDDASSLFPLAIASRVEVRGARFRTTEAGEPRETNPARVWDDFMQVRRELREVIAGGDGVRLGAVSAPHPALGAFTGYDWIAFAGAHAARHAAQIREMRDEGRQGS